MAKHGEIEFTLFKDAVCPPPKPAGTWGDMGGTVLPDAPKETAGDEIPRGTQFATGVPGAPGRGESTSYKTPGSGRNPSGMGE